MQKLSELSPKLVWSIFTEILRIPRPSKHEEQIRNWLVDFAKKNNIECRVDDTGNVIMNVPASEGYEDRNTIILQSHMDMVCEKNVGVKHDFLKDPIDAYLDSDGWVKTKGTTLGADCGIGMSLELALLLSDDYSHPALQAIFTYDEEQGLTGANMLEGKDLEGKYMINLDSEDEGEIFIGCAGGIDTVADFDMGKEESPKDAEWYELHIGGLQGGHSGDDIEKGRASAIKLLARLLYSLMPYNYNVSKIDGGNLRNAIAREASATIAIPTVNVVACMESFDRIVKEISDEYAITDSSIQVSLFPSTESFDKVYCKEQIYRVITSMHNCHHGVVAMSFSMPGLVETSTNLASIKMTDSGIQIVTSQRSSVESAKYNIASIITANFEMAGAQVTHSKGYPGWKPNPNGYLVQTSDMVYRRLFNKAPKIRAIHAGLECGLFIDKALHDIEAISVGPTLRGVHSPSERLDASTVEMVWNYLVALISELK